MKTWMTLIGLFAAATVWAAEEFHPFTAEDGSTFNAVVISCDSRQDSVELLTERGDVVSSGVSDFSDADQSYLEQWERCELFMSPTAFVVVPSSSLDRKWVGKPQENGRDFPMVSGMSEFRHYLTLYNLSPVDFEDLTVDYRILYSQNAPAGADGYAPVLYTVEGSISVDHLEAGNWKMYSSDPVMLTDTEAAASHSTIFVTVSMALPDGSELSRQIDLPQL